VIEAHDLEPKELKREHVVGAFRERIEFRIPISAYFLIGNNAVIEYENNENLELEKLFLFYVTVGTFKGGQVQR
jgi:hypothetical protein